MVLRGRTLIWWLSAIELSKMRVDEPILLCGLVQHAVDHLRSSPRRYLRRPPQCRPPPYVLSLSSHRPMHGVMPSIDLAEIYIFLNQCKSDNDFGSFDLNFNKALLRSPGSEQ